MSVREDGRKRFYRARREALGPVGKALEALWTDALYGLTLHAELEQARRGPLPRGPRRRHRRKPR